MRASESAAAGQGRSAAAFKCRVCGFAHQPVPLRRGERAVCVRCATVLTSNRRLGPGGGLALAVTALILAVPAMWLPFLTAGKLGTARVSVLFTGVDGLWENGMKLLAVWVFLCGWFVPIALLAILATVLWPGRRGERSPQIAALARLALALEHWAMPEVQVLAVLVALMKLGSLVEVSIGPGFWFYSAMSLTLLLAWRSVDLEVLAEAEEPAAAATEVTS